MKFFGTLPDIYFNFEFIPFYITIYNAKMQLEFTQHLTFESSPVLLCIELSTGFESAKSFLDTITIL
jgi:hypothetical protein